MKDLFRIGLNKSGFFVCPANNPPAPQGASSGDEVGFQQAADLCDSLNRSVALYIKQMISESPVEILLGLASRWALRGVLGFIAQMLWRDCGLPSQNGPHSKPCQNAMALERLIQNWP